MPLIVSDIVTDGIQLTTVSNRGNLCEPLRWHIPEELVLIAPPIGPAVATVGESYRTVFHLAAAARPPAVTKPRPAVNAPRNDIACGV